MKHRTIYAYTTKSYNEERIMVTPLWFKVGDTERFNANDRINQQDSTSNPKSLDKKFETQVPYHIRNYQIHERI